MPRTPIPDEVFAFMLQQDEMAIGVLLQNIARSQHESDRLAAARIGGAIASLVGNIPDDVFEKLAVASRENCGDEGCTCHEYLPPLFEALRPIRTFHKQTMKLKEEHARREQQQQQKPPGRAMPFGVKGDGRVH